MAAFEHNVSMFEVALVLYYLNTPQSRVIFHKKKEKNGLYRPTASGKILVKPETVPFREGQLRKFVSIVGTL